MKNWLTLMILFFAFSSCQSQNRKNEKEKIVGGPCEGCEAIYEFGEKVLTPVDSLPKFLENSPKLKIFGTVFQKDGKTPAKNTIVYIYHTNRDGIYETTGNEKGWARRHGIFRGWIKTDDTGNYNFFTFRPAAYPTWREPEHIHFIVKEPGYSEYYIDDIMFADDPYLTVTKRNKLLQRAGSGIVKPEKQGELFLVERDIVLGLNIPDYE